MITDREIQNQITEEINKDNRIDASKVKVKVNNHEVILKGTVPTFRDKQAATADAWGIKGITTVDNQLIVQYTSPPQIPKDAEIKYRIQNLLKWNENIDAQEITVSVQNAWVNLAGNVSTLFEKAKAEDLVKNLHGVLGIMNEITIVPTAKIADVLIAEKIETSLKRNVNLPSDNITVKVKKGEVILTGTVPSYIAKNAAKRTVLYTRGAISLVNKIKVRTLE